MIDITRSQGIFDPGSYRDNIHIIGVGATGSHVCEGLILQGINGNQIHVYDFDKVEEHNIANQIYTYSDIGKSKVTALRDRLKKEYHEKINIYNKKVNGVLTFNGVVFLLVDSWESRKIIYKGLQFKPQIRLVIETGLDARAGRVLTLNPCNINHNKYFEKEFLSEEDKDEGGEVSVCGTRLVVAQTVKMLSAMAIWEFMKWCNDPTYFGNFTYFATQPWYMSQEKID